MFVTLKENRELGFRLSWPCLGLPEVLGSVLTLGKLGTVADSRFSNLRHPWLHSELVVSLDCMSLIVYIKRGQNRKYRIKKFSVNLILSQRQPILFPIF